MKNVFIIGSKGIPAKYGGFETFVEKLTEKKNSKDIKYYVACLAEDNETFEYNSAECFNVNVKKIGSARAVLYDIKSLKRCIEIIKKNNLKDCIIYILACRIGPFIWYYKRKLEKMNVKLYLNPDGHEWKRSKWNKLIKLYWKFSEKLMIKHADFIICDSKEIERYVKEEYSKYNPKTTFLAYGADIKNTIIESSKLDDWYAKNDIKKNKYYLIVGRFVPENNYELMITEFMSSNTNKDLVIVTNVTKCKFYDQLKEKTNFDKDKRIKFVGTVYDQELLTGIRQNAYGYLHGHEVGGTNPSLLEALASTKLNLLLNVNFNKEVGEDGAEYFSKQKFDLKNIIEKVDKFDSETINRLGERARKRISEHYSWNTIVNDYEEIFLNK